ncbi:serine/threonine-protein kinase [Actinomadura sp. SCN-SB]|uniref:serine/threonine-protein kinase n=1 Tax=Actinomadura sp. SCN-SB TaxID=3373092 RepID=UPI003751EE4F
MTEPLHSTDPRSLGRYRITGRLGRGGMGIVYLAEAEHGKQVAIKVINPDLANDQHFRDRFRHEVEAARKVRPFCTAPVLDAALNGHPLYVVTEYIAGPTLEEAIADTGPLNGSDLTALAVGVATALAAIHDAGIVHRDLKPSNVILSGVGPRVIDFGIAKAATRDNLTRAGQYLGTPAYQAPEHIHGGPITPATDVFSWACVVAFAATGHDPFSGTVHDTPRLETFDHELRDLVTRALSKHPGARPTVAELLDRLTGRTSQPPPSTPSPPPQFGTAGTTGEPRQHIRALFPILTIIAVIAAVIVTVPITAAVLDSNSSRANTGTLSPSSGPPTIPPTSSPTSTSTSATPAPDMRSSPPPSIPSDISPHFLGRWTGTIVRRTTRSRTSLAIFTIEGGRFGETVGKAQFPDLDCEASLELIDATNAQLTLTARQTGGVGIDCFSRWRLTLKYRSHDALSYESTTAQFRSSGTLTKSQ